jgi:hypothetical protein
MFLEPCSPSPSFLQALADYQRNFVIGGVPASVLPKILLYDSSKPLLCCPCIVSAGTCGLPEAQPSDRWRPRISAAQDPQGAAPGSTDERAGGQGRRQGRGVQALRLYWHLWRQARWVASLLLVVVSIQEGAALCCVHWRQFRRSGSTGMFGGTPGGWLSVMCAFYLWILLQARCWR